MNECENLSDYVHFSNYILNISDCCFVADCKSKFCQLFFNGILPVFSPTDIKSVWYISVFGLILCIFGECLRKVSMLTAGRSFNHYIQTTRASDHVLVTHGVYAWSRHPSYVGWFYWSLGTQVWYILELIFLDNICFKKATDCWTFFWQKQFVHTAQPHGDKIEQFIEITPNEFYQVLIERKG